MKFGGEQIRPVVLLTRSTTYNSHSEEINTWAADTAKFDNGKLFVEWWDQGGKEQMEGGQIVAYKDVRMKCRFITGLNEVDYRIQKDGKEYDIESVKELGRNEGQILMLKLHDNQ